MTHEEIVNVIQELGLFNDYYEEFYAGIVNEQIYVIASNKYLFKDYLDIRYTKDNYIVRFNAVKSIDCLTIYGTFVKDILTRVVEFDNWRKLQLL